ncbi:MAG: NAD(P)H-binding protein [Croceibacterium sp.]
MSDARRILLAGATGLVGTHVMELAVAHPWARLVALTRREAPMPSGARMEMMVAQPDGWPEAVTTIAPGAVICALGTTMRKAGGEEAFRAIDHDLVLALATAARKAEVGNFVLVSSAGADAFAKPFYLRVKGETETALAKLRFRRLDILRPGLLRGTRTGDFRPLEALARLVSPVADPFLRGPRRQFRSMAVEVLAAAALQCAREKAQGRFVHDHDAIERLARRLDGAA